VNRYEYDIRDVTRFPTSLNNKIKNVNVKVEVNEKILCEMK